MTEIVDIIAREILDSRGNPTVEVDVMLEDGSLGRAAVPSGASTGAHEAVEMRDGDKTRYGGKGVRKAVDAVNGEIFDALAGMDAEDQRDRPDADRARRHAEQEPAGRQRHPRRVAWPPPRRPPRRADLPLYRYVGGVSARLLPVPMMNIINGGAHADNPIDIQEFMILPIGAPTFAEALRMGAEIFHTPEEGAAGRRPQHQRRRRGRLRAQPAVGRGGARLHRQGDRGRRLQGRARTSCSASTPPPPSSSRTASTTMKARARPLDPPSMVDYLADLVAPLSRSSPSRTACAEDDFDGWKPLTDTLGGKMPAGRRRPLRHQPRAARRRASGEGLANSILVKVNQIGTLTETLDAVDMAHRAGYTAVMSPPLGRDRGFDHRRPRRRHQLRADQDRLAGALRPHGQVQPAAAHRGGAGRPGASMPAAPRC